MNAHQLRTTPSYGYDSSHSSFRSAGMPIFAYDPSPGWLVASNSCVLVGNGANSCQFTGKERDSESGLDYFGARYYGSGMGRFTSPDWSDAPEPVPYADPSNPQTLNLYTYTRNNPLSLIDDDGHCWGWIQGTCDLFQKVIDWGRGAGFITFDELDRRRSFLVEHAWNQADADSFKKASASHVTEVYNCGQNPSCLAKNNADAKARDQASSPPPLPGMQGPAPRLISNPKHNPNSASPEPSNVQELFDKSVEDSTGVRWAKDSDGTIHRFSRPSNGETHWNGSTAGPKPIRTEDIPIQVRRVLQ